MWIYADPEELKNYQCKRTLKKEKEALGYHYQYFFAVPPFPSMSNQFTLPQDRLWYTGISSNPLLSLEAHGVDPAQHKQFICGVIPVKFAQELKAEVLTFGYMKHVTDDASDYIAEEQPYTYLYNFLVEKGSVLSIDSSGFTPLKYIPGRPAQIFAWHVDGSRTSQNIETQDRDSYPEILEGLLKKARGEEFTRMLLRCQEATIMQCDFREGGYEVYFDARTSQSGYVYRYLAEEGREGDWEALYDILLYFLRFGKKKRGTKWKYVRKELASDNMRFQNGMISDE